MKQYIYFVLCEGVVLTDNSVVSLLLVHRHLREPGPRGQQLGFCTTAKLVLPKHLAFLLSAPVDVVLKDANT